MTTSKSYKPIWIKTSGIIVIIIGGLQCISVLFLPSGILMIFAGISLIHAFRFLIESEMKKDYELSLKCINNICKSFKYIILSGLIIIIISVLVTLFLSALILSFFTPGTMAP